MDVTVSELSEGEGNERQEEETEREACRFGRGGKVGVAGRAEDVERSVVGSRGDTAKVGPGGDQPGACQGWLLYVFRKEGARCR